MSGVGDTQQQGRGAWSMRSQQRRGGAGAARGLGSFTAHLEAVDVLDLGAIWRVPVRVEARKRGSAQPLRRALAAAAPIKGAGHARRHRPAKAEGPSPRVRT